MRVIKARYEEGLLRPETPLALSPGERVALIVVRHPDPKRWNLARLAKSGAREDLELAEQGLREWADGLTKRNIIEATQPMRVTTGRIVNGKIEVPGEDFPEGMVVTILAPEDREIFTLGPEAKIALLAAIEQADRGELLSEEEWRELG